MSKMVVEVIFVYAAEEELKALKKITALFLSMFLLLVSVPFAQAASLSDITKTNTFYSDINYLVSKGIIEGYPDGTFRPNQGVTRAQAATMIGRALGLNGTKTSTKFSDVPFDLAASGYIQAAADLGIIQGFSDGTFRPNSMVTRGQLAIFIGRAFNLTESVKVTFPDVGKNSAAYPYIGYLLAAEITGGYTDGTYRPNVTVTRGQFSAFMTRILKYLKPGISDSSENEVSTYEKEVLRLVNIERTNEGLKPLILNVKLSGIARIKSQDMYDNNYFSHTSPVYGTPFEMMKQFGISYMAAAENIASGYATPSAVVKAWMNSTGHRQNILNARFTQIGVGHITSGNYWTQMFIGL